MSKSFYMWLFFGITVALVVTVWVMVFSKTIKYSLAGDGKTKTSYVSDQFRELEAKLKNLGNINKVLFDRKTVDIKEDALQEAAIIKMKEKLENITTVNNSD